MSSVIRIKPYHYVHVLDNNVNVTRVEVGPQTFTRKDHEQLLRGPEQMVIIPPRHYCIITNPVARDENDELIVDEHGNVKVRHGDDEIRFEQEPFPLYPGEQLRGNVQALQVVAPNAALRLNALRDFECADRSGELVKRKAGDEWLWEGPGTYKPRVEVQVAQMIRATLVHPNTALQLRARKACVDRDGNERAAGEEWLVRKVGAYLPAVDEEIVTTVKAHTLTDKTALHLRASKTFKDVYGVERKAGAEWLIVKDLAETHIPDVYEEVVGEVRITVLTNRQYCVVLDPVDRKGRPRLGTKELRKGPAAFFLHPGERLEHGIQSVHVLGAEEALLLRAKERLQDGDEVRHPGDRWMIYGPVDYVPPVEVEIVEKRRAIPLDENEGIYVREITSGKVRAVVGSSYMLKPNEELWEMELPKAVEELLQRGQKGAGGPRDKTRVVNYRAPHNTAVQIYDYKEKKARVVFGPALIMLDPDEQFTILSLSGDKPKKPHVIKDIALMLGPDFMTDIVTVETADHARLSLKLSYSWHFDVQDRDDPVEAAKIFTVPDFVGDGCKSIASRVRGAVAQATFDEFHKRSARIIRAAVFGVDDKGKIRNELRFDANGLVITNIDIQSVEPVDQRTRDSLQKSVQLAIEITTNSQEAFARHEAATLEQAARGRLERQKIEDESEAERAKKQLLQLQAQSAAVEATGQATAEAKARAEAAYIEGEAAVELARLKAESQKIKSGADLEETTARQQAEIEHQKALDELELVRSQALAEIEAKKFQDIVVAIGPDTIAAIAQAGPEMQAKLLEGLGIQSVLITDGASPVNLFNTAKGMIESN